MDLKRRVAALLWLVAGAGACTLLVRGTIDEYPDTDGDSDADSDADSDGDGDVEAGVDAGVDAGLDACPGLEDPDAGLESRCRDLCQLQVECEADAGLTKGNCLAGCRCLFAKVYEPEFGGPYLDCVIEQGCLTDETSMTCTIEALPCVDHLAEDKHAFFLECQQKAQELDCGSALGCGLVATLETGIEAWTECLDRASCNQINRCRDEAIAATCEGR